MALVTTRTLENAIRDARGLEHPRRLEIPSGITYTDFAFGFSISGAVVTVNAGKIRHGTRTPITVAQTNVTIGADNTYVFCAYTFGSGAASISSSTSEPVDTEEVHNHILYLVTLTSGVASIGAGNIRHIGDIWLPGSFA